LQILFLRYLQHFYNITVRKQINLLRKEGKKGFEMFYEEEQINGGNWRKEGEIGPEGMGGPSMYTTSLYGTQGKGDRT
jgi:hypothetical protein